MEQLAARASIKGTVALVTGANSGIGRVTARELAARGAHVFLACRSPDKARPVAEEIRRETGNDAVECLSLDLGDLDSVRQCAKAFLTRGLPLNLLVNNGGVAGQRGLTPSGFELAFGVNHVGHFLLTRLLLERLEASAPARVVNVASKAHRHARTIDFEAVRRPTASLTALPEYAVSKLANVLFSAELARREQSKGVASFALHPGEVASNVWRSVPWPVRPLLMLLLQSVDEGAKTSLYCALSPEAASGHYYEKCAAKTPGSAGGNASLAAELWRRSEEWTSHRCE